MIKTIALAANTEKAQAVDNKYVLVKNMGNTAVYASKKSTIVADADEVQCILPQTAEIIKDVNLNAGTANVYFLCAEANKIEIQTSSDVNFKKLSKGGELEEFALNKLTLNDLKIANNSASWVNNVYTSSGITYTVNLLADGHVKSITVNGTASATSTFVIKKLDTKKLVLNKNYWLMGSAIGSTSTHFLRLALNETLETWKENKNDVGAGVGFTATYEYYSIYLRVVAGVAVSNAIYVPVLLKDFV